MIVSILFAIEATIAIAESSSGQRALRGLKNVPCYVVKGHACGKRPVPTIVLPEGCILIAPDLMACEAPVVVEDENLQII